MVIRSSFGAQLHAGLITAFIAVALCFLPFARAEQDKEDLARSVGVHYRLEGGQDAYYLHVHGKKVLLFRLNPDKTGLEDARKKLASLVDSKMRDLKLRYKVSFGKENERTSHGGFGPLTKESGYVKARRPRLDELYGVEAAIKHSMPSHLLGGRQSGKGIKFYFLKEIRVTGAFADFGFDRKRKPACFIEPSFSRLQTYPTEEDAPQGMNVRTLEGLLVHELAHNSMKRMGLDVYNTDRWKMARKIGWQPFYNSRTGESSWRFKSSEGSDVYYKFYAYREGMWIRCDSSGRLLKKDGSRARNIRNAYSISNKQMRNVADMHPCTTYFQSPLEMFADSLMLYRLKSGTRKRLRNMNRRLYEIVKEYDQKEVDKTYGRERFVRSPDGLLVEPTPAALDEINSFEEQQF